MRIDANQCMGLVIDIQEKLFPHMHEREILLQNTSTLICGLKLFDVPFILNEQYPKGIGRTLEPLRQLLGEPQALEKFTFSCCKTQSTMDAIKNLDKKFVIIFGIEAHVCVLQSVLDLLEEGLIPVVVADCTSSRKEQDTLIAIERMRQSGAIITSYESLLFELCVHAKNSVFKEISRLVK